jgi:hypothetical protein
VAFVYDEDGENAVILNTLFSDEAIEINDDGNIDSYTREQKLIEHFKQIDVEVVFTNDYNDTGNIDRVEEKHAVV